MTRESDDPARQAPDLPAPTVADIGVMYLLAILADEKPKRLRKFLAMARDQGAWARVTALHGATGDPDWNAAFVAAEARIESVVAMLEAEPRRRRKKA